MSVPGHKRKSQRRFLISALPLKTDINHTGIQTSFAPGQAAPDIRRRQLCDSRPTMWDRFDMVC